MTFRRLALLLLVAAFAAAPGCTDSASSTAEADGNEDALPSTVLDPYTDVFQGEVYLGVGNLVRPVNYGIRSFYVLSVFEHVKGYVVEVEWAANSPNAEVLSLQVKRSENQDPLLHKVTGPSPLRLAIPIDQLPGPGEYDLGVRAGEPVGAVYDQHFTMRITTFVEAPFDPEYRAAPRQ